MDMFESFTGIYIAPDVLHLVMQEEEAITIEGTDVKNMKAKSGLPDHAEGYEKIEQDGIKIYIASKINRNGYNININRRSWWKPGKLEIKVDTDKPPLPRL